MSESEIEQRARELLETARTVRRADECPPDAQVVHMTDALRAIARALSGSEWRPIESAPKDGTEVLCAWHAMATDRWIIEGCWFLNNQWRVGWDETEVQPTHWMPLPAAPEVKS